MDLWVKETILDKLQHQYKIQEGRAQEKSKPVQLMQKSYKINNSLKVQHNHKQQQLLLEIRININCKQIFKIKQLWLVLCGQIRSEIFKIIDLNMVLRILHNLVLVLFLMVQYHKIKTIMGSQLEQLIFQTLTSHRKTQ